MCVCVFLCIQTVGRQVRDILKWVEILICLVDNYPIMQHPNAPLEISIPMAQSVAFQTEHGRRNYTLDINYIKEN